MELVTTNHSNQPISPFSGEAQFVSAQRIGNALCSSSLVPEIYRGSANMGNVLIAMELSGRLGASVLAVMQNMHVIHGRPSLGSPFLIATVNQSGKFSPLRFRFSGTEGTDEWGCRAVAKDLKTGEELVGSCVSIAMAKAEGWHTKAGSKWKTMPEQMLQYRAAAFWTRAYAPEVSLGMVTRDEAEDMPVHEVTVAPVIKEVEAPRKMRRPATATEVSVDAVVVQPVAQPVAQPVVQPVAQPVAQPVVTVSEVVPEAVADAAAIISPFPTAASDLNANPQVWMARWLGDTGIPTAAFYAKAVDMEWPGFEAIIAANSNPHLSPVTPELVKFVQRSERSILRQFAMKEVVS